MGADADVVVVGGGAAGIIAAARAAELGKRVLLLEKNDRLGMKILISGGGKCNLTHDGSMEELRAKFRQNEARFLKPCFYKYTNSQFLSILHRRQMTTYVRPDGRVFPVEPGNAKTVVDLLTRYVEEAGVRVRYNCTVTNVSVEADILTTQTAENEIDAKSIILAAGGSSYPATGTTGDGWRWVGALGHTIVPLRAALAPILLAEPRPDWAGVALREIVLKGREGRHGKEFVRWSGDLLYTHKGISGPTALGISREVAERMATSRNGPLWIEADLVPSQSFESLRERLRAEATAGPRRAAATLVTGFLPSRLTAALFELSGSDPEQRAGQLTAKGLTKLVTTLKEWPLGQPSAVPLERGEVVAGGVALDEVDPQTMESRVTPGVFICGEMLDIAGPVGGYNLQAAWSTGWVAGTAAAERR